MIIMANAASNYLFLFLLSILTISSSEFVQKELKIIVGEKLLSSSRRELVYKLKTSILDDTTIFPTTPIPPDNNPTGPTIVTVPATNPVTVTPANPDTTPSPTTQDNIPPATPAAPITNPPAPVTVPGGAQPVTNPVTTYPPAGGNNVPVTTNAPASPGQSWCVSKTGVSEVAIQQALDYACGTGGADCSMIQQGGGCYNPNSLQNHASYAFNSYYQKNPSPLSCDFGGTAMIVNINPSTGSCIYPSTSSPSSSTSPPLTTPAQPASTTPPVTTITPPVTTSPEPGIQGPVTPPAAAVLNSSNPASVFGSDSPPLVNTSTSTSAGSPLILSSLTLITSIVTGIIILHIYI